MTALINILKFRIGLLILAFSLIGLVACKNNPTQVNPKTNNKTAINEQDVQLANNVLSQSLASNSDGLMSSMYDLTGTITPTGFHYDSRSGTNTENTDYIAGSNEDNGDNSGDNRGKDSGFRIHYNPKTGIHTVEFNRELHTTNIDKTLHLKLEYIFRDTLGVYLQFPVPSKIESIDYKGLRHGTLKTPKKNSTFSRIDTLYFSGLQDASNTLTLNGSHTAYGEIQMTDSTNQQLHKKYSLRLKLINVTISKDSLYHDKNLENAITGVLNYDVKIRQVNDSTKVDQSFTGTVNLNGNGYALLKFVNFPKKFLVNLKNGDIKQDNN
ncbi:MAG TPA: hypothetical protein VKA34_19880 [Balneolales bacterium]|nr:hypothetical protein [Balneolales bacterium]